MKLRWALLGAVFLTTGFSGNLVYAQEAVDEVISTGTRTGTTYDPYDYPWPLGYDEKCGPDIDEDCYDEDGDDDWGGGDDGYVEDTVDEVVTTSVIQRQFDIVYYLMRQLSSHYTGEDGFTETNEWFLDHGMMPVPYAFYASLIESIEQAIDQMMANLLGELIPQLIAQGILVPADAAAIAEQMGDLNGALNELAEQLRQLANNVNANSADIEAMRAGLDSVVTSLDSTIALLESIQAGIDNNSTEFAQIAGAVNNLHRTRDAVVALRLMGVGN